MATVDLTAVAEALGDASGETAWWYDPGTGEVEMRAPDWTGVDDEDDNPSERGLVPIEPAPSRDAYRDMLEFAESVTDAHASDLLVRALEGRGAFRRFRDTLHEFPNLHEQWHTYARAADERRAIDWLVDWNHVDPADGETEHAARTATMAAVLTAISSSDAAEFHETDLSDRWDQVRDTIDSGDAITILRDGKPWATITPARPERRG
ncbi:UPF0158 family protein [Ilumatobacter sp.]|uniref:UPF0158 family protein n=1 Tax=Ilumatobacter sp. TaxID=1967498 RepID=UPI003AF9B99A